MMRINLTNGHKFTLNTNYNIISELKYSEEINLLNVS